MKNKIIYSMVCLLITGSALFSCNKKTVESTSTSTTTDDYVYAYCNIYYNAGSGNYGSFTIKAMDEGELETEFTDLTKFKLGNAFSNMQVAGATYNEYENNIRFDITGALSAGEYGTIEGEGILKNRSVKVSIPITEASASTDDIIYEGLEEQKINISLSNACFNKDIKPSDFKLTGAAKNMTVESIVCEPYVDEDGDEQLTSEATLTLKGNSNGSDYAYISISNSATTYNKDIDFSIKTDYCGAYILNDCIDTFTLSDVVNIQASNVEFSDNIKKGDISFDGVLKDYATVKSVEKVSSQLLNVNLEFPYTYLNTNNTGNIGYIKFNENATTTKKEVICTAIVGAPKIHSTIQVDGKNVTIEFCLENEEWNLLDFSPFTLTYPNGTKILPSNVEVTNIEKDVTIKFKVPDDCSGLVYFTLEDAYDIISTDGTTKTNISVKTILYI